jgi:hypothetical protein
MFIYLHKIPVNIKWILWTHLVSYTLSVIRLMFPTGVAYMATGQSRLLSKELGVCKCKYQGRVPESCKNTKFITHFYEWNLLWRILYVAIIIYLCLIHSEDWIGYSRKWSCAEGIGSAVNVLNWLWSLVKKFRSMLQKE